FRIRLIFFLSALRGASIPRGPHRCRNSCLTPEFAGFSRQAIIGGRGAGDNLQRAAIRVSMTSPAEAKRRESHISVTRGMMLRQHHLECEEHTASPERRDSGKSCGVRQTHRGRAFHPALKEARRRELLRTASRASRRGYETGWVRP